MAGFLYHLPWTDFHSPSGRDDAKRKASWGSSQKDTSGPMMYWDIDKAMEMGKQAGPKKEKQGNYCENIRDPSHSRNLQKDLRA